MDGPRSANFWADAAEWLRTEVGTVDTGLYAAAKIGTPVGTATYTNGDVVASTAISLALPVGGLWGGAATGAGRLGDLTAAEVRQIQQVRHQARHVEAIDAHVHAPLVDREHGVVLAGDDAGAQEAVVRQPVRDPHRHKLRHLAHGDYVQSSRHKRTRLPGMRLPHFFASRFRQPSGEDKQMAAGEGKTVS